jgi:hypothetical protein
MDGINKREYCAATIKTTAMTLFTEEIFQVPGNTQGVFKMNLV